MYQNLKTIIPHREPMVMIDGYEKIDKDNAISEKTFLPDDYSIYKGYVVESILIECIAQTVAAHFGFDALDKEDEFKKPGMLVTVDTFSYFERVKEGAKVDITIKKTNEIGPFCIYFGKITCNKKPVAEGEIKLFVP